MRIRFIPSRSLPLVRGIVAAVLGISLSVVTTVAVAKRSAARTTARLNSAATRLDSLTDGAPADDPRRAAIAWGYAERLRVGLESPFRLIETAARDTRLTPDERRTVAWALLAHVTRGEAARFDVHALDDLGPRVDTATVAGAQHVRLIRDAIQQAKNPRAAELAVRLAYTLAATERVVDGAAPILSAQAAALIADGEIARREAASVIRSARGRDPIEEILRRRARRAFFVERPVLLAAPEDLQRDAIALVPTLLDSIRGLRPRRVADSLDADPQASVLAPRLFAAGAQAIPAAPLAVTVRRYLTSLRSDAPSLDADALSRARNSEMLLAATRSTSADPVERRAVARLLLATGVAMRSVAQDPVWTPADSVRTAAAIVSIGAASVTFDRDVPSTWRSYYVLSLADAVTELRRVFPKLRLDGLHVRFRMSAPADSALAMHDPRTRTLHLPIVTAAGTLAHELAHDLDRQSALGHGLAGYRSDLAARGHLAARTRDARVAASLRALTEELAQTPAANANAERPAEIFATRVDWFVASSLAREGRSDGFLSAVEDELLTGHVVHPERLRGTSRSLVTALEGMTTVAPFAEIDAVPSAQTMLRWSLAAPVDRREATALVRGDDHSLEAPAWIDYAGFACNVPADPRAALVRLAAESRARGWIRLRARWTPDTQRPSWAHAALGQAPWASAIADRRIAALRDYILLSLATPGDLPSGLAAYATPIARDARCRAGR